MTTKAFFTIVAQLALAGAVLLLSHYGYSWVAALLLLVPSLYGWLRARRSRLVALAAVPDLLVGLSVIILVGLSKPPLGQAVFPVATQITLAVAFAAWLMWQRSLRHRQAVSLATAGTMQVAAVTALFLATAFWHWPETLTVGGVAASVGVSTYWYLRGSGERAAAIMATAWALVAGELAWVLYAWQVNYILFGSGFIVPQAALVVFGVGYCFASIYHSHREKRLSRRRLIEFVAIAGVLLAIVIAGTRWNGAA